MFCPKISPSINVYSILFYLCLMKIGIPPWGCQAFAPGHSIDVCNIREAEILI